MTVRLQESAGVAVTINSLELFFSNNSGVFGSLTPQTPFSSKLSANGTLLSRTINVVDDNAGNPFATRAEARAAWTDDNSNTGLATGSAELPALPAIPVINSFSTDRTSLTAGQAAVLSWSVSNAASVSINNGIGTVAASGQRSVMPTSNTTYILTASNAGGSTTSSLSVSVDNPPPPNPPTINSFSSNRSSLTIGESVTLSWSVSGATSISINHGVGAVAAEGSRSVTPPGPVDYTITASNSGGSANKSISLSVTVPGGICAASTVPANKTAVCNDGTYSESQNRSGTCSSHGGVRCWVCPGPLCSG